MVVTDPAVSLGRKSVNEGYWNDIDRTLSTEISEGLLVWALSLYIISVPKSLYSHGILTQYTARFAGEAAS